MEWLAVATALWLGILTSISPCPLTMNIAAISFLGRRVDQPGRVLLASAGYVAGRVLTYLVVAAVVVAGLLTIPGVSNFLQRYMNLLLGPLLVLTGLFLLGVLRGTLPGFSGERFRRQAEQGGVWGAGLLGMVFALTFCPVSAALFFGSLIPLAVQHSSRFLLPGLYGIGTGLPVVAFAVLVAVSAHSVGRAFNRLSQIERWARRATGIIFILVGVHYILVYFLNIDVLSVFY